MEQNGLSSFVVEEEGEDDNDEDENDENDDDNVDCYDMLEIQPTFYF